MNGKEEKYDWRLGIATAAGVLLIIVVIVAVFSESRGYFFYYTVYFGSLFVFLYFVRRAVRAHERLANAAEKLAGGETEEKRRRAAHDDK